MTDSYWRRREAGDTSREQTRQKLLESADLLFRTNGYSSTTVTAIAKRAGVSVQTLYLAWGNKRALFSAAADRSMNGDSPASPAEVRRQIHAAIDRSTGPDPTTERYVHAVVDVFASLADSTATYWKLTRDAAQLDPEIAADFALRTAERRRTLDEVAARLPLDGVREGVDERLVADTLWALISPEVHTLITESQHGSLEYYRRWLTATLTAALCAPEGLDAGATA